MSIILLPKQFYKYRSQQFTSSGTFIPPKGRYILYITAVGGGGGGGGSDVAGTIGAGGGGGGARCFRIPFYSDSDVISSISVTIGTGGAGGNNTGAND